MLVKMIGSKKKPMLPIILPATVGRLIFKRAFDSFKSNFKSSFLIVIFLGRKIRRMIIEKDSLRILKRIKVVIVIIGPYLVILGRIQDIIAKRNNCSRTLLII